ncbi:hypothetical protein N7495_002705 [Penicillium taxi]|uniref:uncharacterized protein n=1 Tax=Penicillium taxi TaxID=168475 RepID=UPI002544E8A8|nr:uncharacterized protein N7495_002705 [Penicillium taxi]KAJ5902177.1 hypothetical protein N7495_002705 [Penicillium taxi]
MLWPRTAVPRGLAMKHLANLQLRFQKKETPLAFVSVAEAHSHPSSLAVPRDTSVPSKRKSTDVSIDNNDQNDSSTSDEVHRPSHRRRMHSNGQNESSASEEVERPDEGGVSTHMDLQLDSTSDSSSESPLTPTQAQRELAPISVIVPSPAKLNELTGRDFSINFEQKKSAARRAYPKARIIDRSKISFPEWENTEREPCPPDLIRRSLNQRLEKIAGPEIFFMIDEERLGLLTANFQFVDDYILGEGTSPVDEAFNYGCNCVGPCEPTKCDCLHKEIDSNELIVPYHRSPTGQMVLYPSFLERKSMISECNYKCSCSGDCWNNVVQRGRQIRYEIFDTVARLRSPDNIVTGQFIDRYLGEVMSKEAADARERCNEGQSYLFGLDFVVDDETIYVIDGQKFGSATRFINHSCNPNCKIIPVSTSNHGDDRLYYLAFFAVCDIPAGTELTFDYNPSWDGSKVVNPDAVQCLCGENNCRGQLWPNARKGPGAA